MYVAFFKLKKIKTKALIIAYHNLMSQDAKLIADLKTRYFANVSADIEIQVMTLRQACDGMLLLSYCSQTYYKYFNILCVSIFQNGMSNFL